LNLAWRDAIVALKTTEPETRRRTAGRERSEPGHAIDECLFCHRPANIVEFVVRDRRHGYNVCVDCLGDCARTVACSCVC